MNFCNFETGVTVVQIIDKHKYKMGDLLFKSKSSKILT
jgi:hypothetical protein